MFKSIQWKLVLLYLLLVTFTIIIISVLLIRQVEDLYYSNFEKNIKSSMAATGFSNKKIEAVNLVELKDKVAFYSSMFLIDGLVRKMYILDNFGIVKYSSDVLDSEQEIDKIQFATLNVRKAILNQVGDVIDSKNYLDYAQPVITKDGKQYIIYITDNKAELQLTLDKIKRAILISIFFSFIFSTIIGFLLARTITVPIKNLAQKAKKISEGDFEQRIEVKSKDEIGQLTRDFNHMAAELKYTLREISNEKSKVETILHHMADGVMAFDQNGNIIHINPAAKKILNAEISTGSFDEIFSELDIDVNLGDFIYLSDDSVKERKVKVGDTYIKMYFAGFNNKNGKIGGIIVVLQDITEQQRLDDMRKEFVANVSHELRTPLTTIKSYVETLLDGSFEDKETAEEFLSTIDTEADRMTRLVKDLLDLSKLDNQQTKWSKEKISIDKIIKDTIKKLSIEAKSKEQKLEYFMTSEVPEIIADRDKIEQVLLNIIGNSIKYTQKGGEISVYYGFLYNEVYIKVIDNGIGIPKKDIPRVFERFFRVDKARSRELGGTGLGLAIAKEIIEAHGGSIDINSQVGKGTEIIISLPIA